MKHTFAAILILTAAAGCTVKPLYGEGDGITIGQGAGASVNTKEELAEIVIAAPDDRVEQEVRNHLIFLFYGGGAEPASPRYILDMNVTAASRGYGLSRNDPDDPTAGAVTVRVDYTLSDAESGNVLHSGSRSATADYDEFDQEFANLRAKRDAENRAAREAAEFTNLAIASEIGR